ncbi:choice-of-anchor J domain-containing protein [Thermodesulfobacteriota bacterium]
MKTSLFTTIRQDQEGGLFVGLIVTMMLFAALGAAMFSYTTTSAYNQVWVNSASKSYYLAESGFRYAESEYNNTGDTDGDGEIKDDRNQLLEGWNSPDSPGTPVLFTFSNNTDNFELKIYPYYLATSATHSKNATSVQTKFPGTQPSNFDPSSASKLKIGSDDPYTISTYNAGTGTFTISPGLVSNLSDNMDVYLVTNPSADSTITKDGDLILDDASFFPDRNGVFSIHGGDNRVYAYKSRSGNTLQTIFDVEDPDGTFDDVAVLASTDIVLNPFVQLRSIGIVEHGASMETKREVSYSVPLSTDTEEEVEFQDTFEDKTNWKDSSLGTHAATGGALRVTGTVDFGGAPKPSLIGLDWPETGLDLGAAHRRGDPFFLSYDAQVKVGFEEFPVPDAGYGPEGAPIPLFFVGGISFRLDENLNSYGLSFLRGSNAQPPGPDNINDDLIPPGKDQRLLIALWQQTNNGTDPDWLAYKDIEEPGTLLDYVESGENLWSTEGVPSPDGLWHISDRRPYAGTYAWYYGRDATGTYNTGAINSGSLISTPINLCDATTASLSFWSWYHTEDLEPWVNDYDLKTVEISTDCGANWTTLFQLRTDNSPANPMDTWQQITLDLTPYKGQSVQIRFRLNTRDAQYNDHEGWYIDDVNITSDATFELNEAALLVRITESASITFDSGGTAEIVDGDVVVGSTSGAQGTVNGAPVVASGSWAGSDAAGTMLLRNITGSFQNEALTVLGSSATATATGFTSRGNYIKAYYGNTSDCGTPNDCALDQNKHGYPRGDDLNWPPEDLDDWAAANDDYTLVQWDEVNAAVSTVDVIPSLDEPNALIESTESILFTPTATSLETTRSELGLHTFGKGSLNIFFDDFGLQAGVISSDGFFPAVQE